VTPAQQRARELDAAAVSQARQGKLAAAVPLWGEALRQNPDDVDVLVHLGHALAAAGEVDKAEELATRAAKLAPQTSPPWLLLGHLARNAGRPDTALESYALAARFAADDDAKADAAVASAEVFVGAGDHAAAEAAVEGVSADRVDVCLVRAFLLAAAGDVDGARALLVRAGEIDPLHPEPFKRLAMLMAQVDRSMALELARHALELGPQDAESQALVAALQG
jgi:tetratricopeptide (TPR) repeat protein